MRINDWSSDVCSSDPEALDEAVAGGVALEVGDVVGLAAEPLRGHEAVQLVARFLQLLDHHRRGVHQPDCARLLDLDPGEQGDGGIDLFLLAAEVEDVAVGLGRSEEHTSELQSLMRISYAVFCLNKKKLHAHTQTINHTKSN